MIFVDSGGWFASVVTDDNDYQKANIVAERKQRVFVDKQITLLTKLSRFFRARGENQRALKIGNLFFRGLLANVYRLSAKYIIHSWEIFQKFSDKDWSFTDCSSKFICEKFGITQAFAFDKHFRQFGTVTVVP